MHRTGEGEDMPIGVLAVPAPGGASAVGVARPLECLDGPQVRRLEQCRRQAELDRTRKRRTARAGRPSDSR